MSTGRGWKWFPTRAPVAALALVALAGCADPARATPTCAPGDRLAILAQAVPSAELVPCVEAMPAGWSFSTLEVERGSARFWLDNDRAGLRALEVRFEARCDTTGAVEAVGEEEGVTRLQRLRSLEPTISGSLSDVFEGGCVTYRFAFEKGPHTALLQDVKDAVALYPRAEIDAEVERDLGVSLTP